MPVDLNVELALAFAISDQRSDIEQTENLVKPGGLLLNNRPTFSSLSENVDQFRYRIMNDQVDHRPVAGAMMGMSTAYPNYLANTTAANFSGPEWKPTLAEVIVGGIFMCFIPIGTVAGNVLVMLSLILVKKLQQPCNLLLVSLSISDQLIAITVEPFALYKTLSVSWDLPDFLCKIHLFLDVMLCTASILNLNAITIDRFLVITIPFKYTQKRNKLLMFIIISCVWILSAIVSASVYLWGKPVGVAEWECTYTKATTYQIYATITAFFAPLTVMLILWGRIFVVARRMAAADQAQQGAVVRSAERAEKQNLSAKLPTQKQVVELQKLQHQSDLDGTQANGDCNTPKSNLSALQSPFGGNQILDAGTSDTQPLTKTNRAASVASSGAGGKKPKGKNENKALITVAVIMGCFSICWLPFFIFQFINPMVIAFTENSDGVLAGLSFQFQFRFVSLLLWLGYVNSFMNPIIYAKFNRDFRRPFAEFLHCHLRDVNQRLRMEQYKEQYGSPAHRAPRNGPRGSGTGSGGSGGSGSGRRGSGQRAGMTRAEAEAAGLLNKSNRFLKVPSMQIRGRDRGHSMESTLEGESKENNHNNHQGPSIPNDLDGKANFAVVVDNGKANNVVN